ncbi:zinc finger and BTB domain-containing protein 17 [Zeugodacus cucurbitae]|uniref:zinc finger and BTB domain-containing protein 17 n=1 Tax=Zeugodacus cucurbitae TaxID=28588 RepID=UPI0023D93245|nr:zinc finger and BTB domain-containing protein 17 [Zeugodacus cucurbitae]
MGGSRSYSVSSTSSVASSSSSSSSGNYSEYSAAGSEERRCKATKLVYSRIGNQRLAATGAVAAGGVMAPQPQQQQPPKVQRARSQRIICRCCLSEQQPATRQSLGSCSEQELDDEEAAHLEFVPLDTLAMVDLSDDRFVAASTAGDSCKTALSRTSPAKGNKVNSMSATTTTLNNNNTGSSSGSSSTTTTSTLLDCLNACAQIGASLADNELPQHICLDCCHTLEMCCEFIRCVRNADKILRRRCALPVKRVRQQQQQQYWQQRQATSSMPAVCSDVYGEEGPAAKRRRRREEKVQQEQQRTSVAHAVGGGGGVSAKSLSLGNNTPKSISLPKSATTATPSAALTVTSTAKSSSAAERDELLDISKALDGVESSFVRSFDSGIEIDEDLCSVKSSDCSANEYPLRCHLAKYEGYTYVVAETLSHDLERFHRGGHRSQASAGGGGATALATTYKCGFCIFECSVRQELNKHLQIHLGPPQHSCRKCNFVGHFKFLLAQHMRNVHHCPLEGQEVHQKHAERGGGSDIAARSYQAVSAAAESPKYHCHLCAECFVNYDGLQQHRKSHKVFCKCTMCTFKSSTRENVLEHMAKEHKVLVERRLIVKYIPLQRINAQQMQELTPTKSVSATTETKFIPKDNKYRKHLCQFCGKCFDRRFHLLKHEYGVHRIEIEQTQSDVDVVIRTKLPSYGAGGNSTKHTKLKYLRQRNAVQAARQQRYIEDLALLDDQQPGQDISNKFQCEICMAVFMFNFELKYHMRTHKTSTHTQTTVGKESADKRIATPTPTLSTAAAAAAVIVQPEAKLSHVNANGGPQITVETQESTGGVCGEESDDDADADGEGEGDGDADDVNLKFTPDISHHMDAALTGLSDGVDLDLMALVAPQTSPLDSLDASPASSNNSFDINYDDQLYLNDFDLGLLDCSGVFAGF